MKGTICMISFCAAGAHPQLASKRAASTEHVPAPQVKLKTRILFKKKKKEHNHRHFDF